MFLPVHLPIILILLAILAVLSFFLSASETAIISLSKIRLRHMVIKRVKHAENVQRLVTKFDDFIAAILVGNNFVNIAMSSIVTAVFVQIFGYDLGLVVAIFVSTFFILIICEVTPKILAVKHSEKISLFAAPIMEAVIKIFKPFIFIFTSLSNFILTILGIARTKRSPLITEEELRLMIEVGKEEGVLSDEERKMLHRIFEFGDTRVGDVMIAKDKMTMVDIKSSAEELLNTFVEQGHARLPVYEGTPEQIKGIVYARDLLYILRDKGLFVLPDLVHEPYFVSPSARVNEVLKRFQVDKIQIAIVVDDKKKPLGLVTLEDLIEEIVGEIEEKHHRHAPKK